MPSPILRHRALLIPAVLFAIALAIRVLVALTWRFDGLYGQDAFAYHDQAVAIEEQLARSRWAPPDFFWPNGFPTLAALSMVLLGASPSAVQALNMVLGAAVVVLIFLTGRDLVRTSPRPIPDRHAERVGMVAAAATIIAGQLVLSSVVVMADMAALFWLSLSAWILVRFVRSPNSWPLLVAAAAAGAAGVVTRWATVLAGPALALAAMAGLRTCRRRSIAVLTAGGAALLVVLPQLMISLSGKDGGFAGYFADWNPLNLFHRVLPSEEGVLEYRFPNGLFYLSPWWNPSLLPPTAGVFAVAGLWAFRQWRHAFALLFVCVWLAVPYCFVTGIPHQNLRYCLTMWTPAVILTAVGVVDVWQKPRWRIPVFSLLLVSALGSVFWNISRWGRFFDTQGQVTALARHLENTLPPDSVVLSFEATATLAHYTDAEVHELFSMDPDEVHAVTDGDDPVWLVVNPEKIETQWHNLSPWNNLRWLHDNRRLVVVDEQPPWVVYSINRVGAEVGLQ